MTHKPPPRWTTGRPALSGRPASARPACLPACRPLGSLWQTRMVRAGRRRPAQDRSRGTRRRAEPEPEPEQSRRDVWLAGWLVRAHETIEGCLLLCWPAGLWEGSKDGWMGCCCCCECASSPLLGKVKEAAMASAHETRATSIYVYILVVLFPYRWLAGYLVCVVPGSLLLNLGPSVSEDNHDNLSFFVTHCHWSRLLFLSSIHSFTHSRGNGHTLRKLALSRSLSLSLSGKALRKHLFSKTWFLHPPSMGLY
jgi:hypothetical protein